MGLRGRTPKSRIDKSVNYTGRSIQLMAKAALTCRRVRHMTDGLSPLFVMPNEYRTVFM